jgi:hypothetical protein
MMHVSAIGWVSIIVRDADVRDVSVLRADDSVVVKLNGNDAGDSASVNFDVALWDRVITALKGAT